MIILHDLPGKDYVKFDKNVFLNHELSDGAKVLYGYMAGLRNGSDFTDTFILERLKLSRNVLARRKKELTDQKLLLVKQIRPRVFMAYIGHTGRTADQVKTRWEQENG